MPYSYSTSFPYGDSDLGAEIDVTASFDVTEDGEIINVTLTAPNRVTWDFCGERAERETRADIEFWLEEERADEMREIAAEAETEARERRAEMRFPESMRHS